MAKDKTAQGTESAEESAAAVENQSLENFDWDTSENGDFFGITNTGVPKEEEVQVKKKKVEDDASDTEEEEEEEKEDSTFFNIDSKGDEAEQEEEGDDDNLKENYYSSLTKKFKEKGIFQNIEIPDGEEITEEKFIEYQDEEIESRVEGALDSFMSELDDDAANFLRHKKEGGSTRDFFAAYRKSSEIPVGDLDDEVYQEKISRYYYTNIENLDAEDVDDRITWLKDSDKLSKYAAKQDSKIKDLDKKNKEDLQKSAKEDQRLQQEAKEKFVSTVKETLEKTNEIDNFKFTPQEKKDLHAFITKPSIKVANNKYLTGMQSKLQETLRDPQKMLLLAKLLKNDFDVSDVVAATTTETVKGIRKNIQRAEKTVAPAGSGRTSKKRNLADFF